MKKLVIVLLVALMIMGCNKSVLKPALAESLSIGDTLKKIPALKQGLAYSIIDSDFSYLSTIELANWKGLTLEAGYSSKDKIVGVISYQLLKLKDLGIKVPILDLIEFNLGLYGGYGRLNMQALDKSEWDAGCSITLVSVRF